MTSPSGYYEAQGDPPGTVRYWDGERWTTEPMVPPPLPAFFGFVPYIGGLIGVGFLVMTLVWVNTDPQRRSAYDRLAGTRVVRKSHL